MSSRSPACGSFLWTPQPADLDPSKMCAMDVDEMHNLRGRVCLLNYNCSGILEPFQMAGLPKHITFLKSPLSLRVGQTVRFRIVRRGDDLQAVDISSVESEVYKHQERGMPSKLIVDTIDLNTSPTLGTSVEKPKSLDSGDVMSSLPAHRQSMCFLRRMSQFRNSSQAEQVQLVTEAERSLDRLLGQSTLDGDAICRLARKCASWLHPPVLQSANPQRQSDPRTARGTEDQVNLQGRIRKILIEALNHLDLQDPSTLEAMKAALFYMASLCERLNEKCGSSSVMLAATPATEQWQQLKSLLEESGLKSLASAEMSRQPPFPRVEDQSKPGPLPSAENPQEQVQEMADAVWVAGVEHEHEPTRRRRITEYYEPSAIIKALSTVSQGTPVKLMCSECPFTVTSSWYFQHPKTLKRSVISPQRGHTICQHKSKKRCYWKNLDFISVIRAYLTNFKFCLHKRLLADCAACGGVRMCIHARQRNKCKECKHLSDRRGAPKNAEKVLLEVLTGEREHWSCNL